MDLLLLDQVPFALAEFAFHGVADSVLKTGFKRSIKRLLNHERKGNAYIRMKAPVLHGRALKLINRIKHALNGLID